MSSTETFEGLGIGSRLAYMKLPSAYSWVPIAGAILYGLTTPIGIAVGLGIRSTYNPGGATASAVSGILDSLSAGILIYTGLVEVGFSSRNSRVPMLNITSFFLAACARVPFQQGGDEQF